MIIPLYEEWDYPKECTNFVFLGMVENGDSLPFEVKEWNKNFTQILQMKMKLITGLVTVTVMVVFCSIFDFQRILVYLVGLYGVFMLGYFAAKSY